MKIESGCLALVINTKNDYGVVTVGKCLGRDLVINNEYYQGYTLWEVDKTIQWFGGLGYRGEWNENFLPEKNPLRIDGHKESVEQRLKEAVK